MNNFRISIYFCLGLVLFISACSGCVTTTTPTNPETPPVDDSLLCDNNLKDTVNGELGIDCGGPNCQPCHDVDPSKELVINDLAVVNSEAAQTGSLSFGRLLEKMSDDNEHYRKIINSLFRIWSRDTTINQFLVRQRPSMENQTIGRWLSNQGLPTTTTIDQWNPDPDKAPFRLLAITNRVDLSDLPNKAGEGRLTFGQDDSGGNDFTLIFEYKLPGDSEDDVIEWAQRFHALSALDITSVEYLNTLIGIVEDFTRNGNDLAQIRTNSVIGGSWEFRELNWNDSSKLLEEVTRKQNPDVSLQGQPTLINYLNDPTNNQELQDGDHQVKLSDGSGSPILAGNTTYGSTFTWSAPGVDQEVLNTLNFISCTGCHGGFTPGGVDFTHIKPRSENNTSELSILLEGAKRPRRQNVETLLELPRSAAESVASGELSEIIALIEAMEGVKTVH